MKIIKVSTTSWLTHGEGCIRLLERFSHVLDALDSIIASKKCPTSIGLRKLLLKPNTLKGLLVLADVLKILNVLSRLLQEKNLPFTKVSAKVSRVKERIHDLFRNPDSSHRCWLKPEVEEKIFKLALPDHPDLMWKHPIGKTTLTSKCLRPAYWKKVNPIISAFDLYNPDLLPLRNEASVSSCTKTILPHEVKIKVECLSRSGVVYQISCSQFEAFYVGKN